MRRYGEKILHALLDKYENSLLYRGENKRNQTIGFAVKKSTLPEYFDETSQEYAVIHAQLWELEDKGFLLLHWKDGKEGHILERCTLQAEQVSGAYEFLSRYPKREKEERLSESAGILRESILFSTASFWNFSGAWSKESPRGSLQTWMLLRN